MSANTIDAQLLSRMFLAGAQNLEVKKEWINELNVFPVPDGDTGTNMTLTIMSAANEVRSLEKVTMKDLAKAISSGSLRGARGNSGVILSQLLRGFTKVIQQQDQVTIQVLAAAFEKAVETAYKAVMKPKEGTILTVAREMAEKAVEIAPNSTDMDAFIQTVFMHGVKTLERTPEMLPVLKEAGVVDSGGQGLIEVLRGAIDGYLGKEIDDSFQPMPKVSAITKISAEAEEEIKFGYCTEFIVLLNKPLTEEEEDGFKDFLNSIGDSIVLVADEEICKVHVHTNHPGEAFEKGLTFGALSRMKVDNMREEHQEKLIKDAAKVAKAQAEEAAAKAKKKAVAEAKDYGFISVSVGDGIKQIFTELGVDYLIEGGQTMNPSTEDMLTAIDQVNAKTIFILPNNKNIVLAANQARDLTTDKQIIVIPTKTIPQGIATLISFTPDASPEENEEAMVESMGVVKTGQITYAVRNTSIDGKEIHDGDIMGIGDSGILAVGKGIESITMETIAAMADEDAEIISVYYGSDVEEDQANELLEKLEEEYPDCDIELNYGGQPIYYYIVSVE